MKIEFESPASRAARVKLETFDTLDGDRLVDALITAGVFVDRQEMLAEFRAWQDPRHDEFGGRYSFDDYLRDMRQDWIAMLQMIVNGDVRDSTEAREKMYDGGDTVSHMRRNAARRHRNVVNNPKPR